MKRHATFLPVFVALFGLGCFSVMDGVMKAASLSVGPYGALFWRNMLGSLFMLPVYLRARRRADARGLPGRDAMKLHWLRSSVAGTMAVLFFYGVVRTPLAESIALTFIAPLIALYLAAVTLGEKVGSRAVAGSVLALGGVVVIAAGKFGGRYDAEAVKGLVALLVSAVLYAWNLVLQRRQAQVAGPEEIAFFQTFLIFLLLGIGAWWLAPLPAPVTWIELAISALLSVGSLMLLGWAYARAEAQVLVPLEYTAFIWAALVGWIGFGEALTLRTLGGVVLIVAGCLIALQRSAPSEMEMV
ncbi:DMT family transporter [Novosphingobium cyanobacteriorum]|uniref:DMT family transporter n=1 Tax=Novosphingobium cyanobacteriorum TaxID=3024215 RepID=A0ABT6CI96_9SPHN|nr:DMT family transporter [Novosphingobium cyanobacteriorum]MDF8333537.1 DMT family transporter [Novosphingobium cyanobacteriorum]